MIVDVEKELLLRFGVPKLCHFVLGLGEVSSTKQKEWRQTLITGIFYLGVRRHDEILSGWLLPVGDISTKSLA